MEGAEYSVRELDENLLRQTHQTFFETLANLREVGDVSVDRAVEILKSINEQRGYIYVAYSQEHGLVGATTLIVEQKFIRQGGKVGHIEDVATRKGFEGRGIGKAVMNAALERAKTEGCYKVILDCSDKNVPFYEKLGFRRYENCMRVDL